METVFENDYAIVKVYPDKKIVHHEIKKFIFGDYFKEMMTSGADAYEKNQCSKWLSDDSKNNALRDEDRIWGETEWGPRIIKAGWKAWAIVVPEKVIGQMNMKKIAERYSEMGVIVEVFDDPAKAMSWLEQQ